MKNRYDSVMEITAKPQEHFRNHSLLTQFTLPATDAGYGAIMQRRSHM